MGEGDDAAWGGGARNTLYTTYKHTGGASMVEVEASRLPLLCCVVIASKVD